MASPGFKKALLCSVTLCFWFAQYIYVPFLTPYLLSLAISATAAGIIIGAYGVTQMVLRIPLGLTLDIYRQHKLVIVIGVLLAGLSSLGMLLFPSPAMLFASNALSGVASSAWISYTILYTSYYDSAHSTRAIGAISMVFQSGILLAFLAGGLLVSHFGIQMLFKVSFASGVVGALLALFIPRESASKGTNVTLASLLKVVRDRRVVTFSLLSGMAWFVVFATVFSFSTSTAKSLGATGPQLGVFSMLYSAGTIAGAYFITTRFGHSLGEKWPLSLGFMILALYCVFIGLARVSGLLSAAVDLRIRQWPAAGGHHGLCHQAYRCGKEDNGHGLLSVHLLDRNHRRTGSDGGADRPWRQAGGVLRGRHRVAGLRHRGALAVPFELPLGREGCPICGIGVTGAAWRTRVPWLEFCLEVPKRSAYFVASQV